MRKVKCILINRLLHGTAHRHVLIATIGENSTTLRCRPPQAARPVCATLLSAVPLFRSTPACEENTNLQQMT
jgi:hypothetical protein